MKRYIAVIDRVDGDDVATMVRTTYAGYYLADDVDKRITELEARLDQQKDEYEGLIDVAESNYKKLEKQLEAQLESVRSATECIGHDRDCTWHSGSGMCVCGLDELQAALEEVSDAGQDLLDATGHSTWSKLFKAPEVETAIRNFKAALQGEKE